LPTRPTRLRCAVRMAAEEATLEAHALGPLQQPPLPMATRLPLARVPRVARVLLARVPRVARVLLARVPRLVA
jgi:hypothetical protein